MRKITLKRFISDKNGTLGKIYEGDRLLWFSLEPPWKNNEKDISCIPEGTYVCHPVTSPKFGFTFEVQVPERESILFHSGNRANDTKGCIVMGKGNTSFIDDFVCIPAVFQSRNAMEEFRKEFQDDKYFFLEVKGVI